MSLIGDEIVALERKLASATATPATPTEPLVARVTGTWISLAEGVCEGHNWVVRYNLTYGYQRHLDGSACNEIILPLERP